MPGPAGAPDAAERPGAADVPGPVGAPDAGEPPPGPDAEPVENDGASVEAAAAAAPSEPGRPGSGPTEPPWQLTPTPPWPPATPPPGTPAVVVGGPPPMPAAPPGPGAPPPPAGPHPGAPPPAPPAYGPGPVGPPAPHAPAPGVPAPGVPPQGYGYSAPPAPGPGPGGFGGPAQGFGAPGGPVVVDPHGVGMSASRLSGGGRRAGKVALAVLATALEEGDVVAIVVQGRFRGEPGVAALTEGKVVLVNDRQWKPDVVVLPVDADLAVHGWQDERTAALTFVSGERQEFIERVGDRGLAIEFAQRVRHALGEGDAGTHMPPVPPPPSMPG